MKYLNNFINEKLKISKTSFMLEKLKINSKSKINNYNYKPKDKYELEEIVGKLIKERGNNADLNDIDTSKITDMSQLFYDSDFNGNVSKWNITNVKTTESMFFNCKNFNCDLSDWDVSGVENMFCMFYGCNEFNQNLEKWQIKKDADTQFMFGGCNNLNKKPSWYKTY